MRRSGRLTTRAVETATKVGLHGDGAGLYLRVTPESTKNWVYRFTLDGRARYMGLGPFPLISLAAARGRALDARRLAHDGHDPIDTRRSARTAARLEAAKSITFQVAAERYVAAHRHGWRSAKHANQWKTSLATYAEPIVGNLSVAAIDTGAVMRVLEQKIGEGTFWTKRPETASRVRQRIERVLDWATTRNYRGGANPARWSGHIENLLPARTKIAAIAHHAALPYTEIGDFMTVLRQQDDVGARALEFAVLTAARTGEVIGATWAEIDLAEAAWTIPAERMKARREHRIPLSLRAVEILEAMKPESGEPMASAFVFPGVKAGRPLSPVALERTLQVQRSDVTVHGFRSTFRDWAAERTGFARELAETALAHKVGNETERAYQRGDLFGKRRQLMDAWAKFCGTSKAAEGQVTPMRRSA